MNQSLRCQRVLFSGRVQGVGFRQTTRDLADSFPVSGYVRNLENGNVELVVQGETSRVEAFVTALCHKMTGYIRNTTVHDEEPGNWDGFVIRYD